MGGQVGISFAGKVADPKFERLTASNLTLFGRKQTDLGSWKKLTPVSRDEFKVNFQMVSLDKWESL